MRARVTLFAAAATGLALGQPLNAPEGAAPAIGLHAAPEGTTPPAVDRWLLDGHGTGRALFAPPAGAGGWSVSTPRTDCRQLQFYTPFSSYSVNAGLAARDGAGQSPQLAVPMYCGAGAAAVPFLWVVNPLSGATIQFGALPHTQSLESYAKYLPDGTIALGTNGSFVSVFDPATLELLYSNGQVAGGGGGAQVLAVTKPTATQPSQLQVAGGTGGPEWWGASADLPLTGASWPFTNVKGNADSTVCMGADGRSMFNNQRFESPGGVTRFTMPFPSAPESYNTGSQQWPWQMRSAYDGRVAALEDGTLTLYAGAAGHAVLWRFAPLVNDGPATLAWSDDESVLVFSNATHLVSLSAATGKPVVTLSFTGKAFGASACAAQQSPWAIPNPVPLPGAHMVVVLCSAATGGGHFARTVDALKGTVSATSAAFEWDVDQALADARGNVYAVGIATDAAIALARVAVPAL